jgi:glycosyltransferase involved in cell wall biosynthesis
MGASISDWILRNGVKHEQVISIDATPNRLMPEVFREVDLAIFPSRCEGGTNLVAMEALAFGLPCLISKNTGHLDIIGKSNCLPLTQQKSINRPGFSGWGESSVDEVVDMMEEVYQGRAKINPMTARESMLPHSWENAINSMLSLF